jgi:hypothetical protein
LATLDQDGTSHGLPFMPEMVEFCGRPFRVLRRAEKVCYDGSAMEMREFRNNDVVLLEAVHCSGADHGKCQRGCMIFWKETWLRKMNPGEPSTSHGLEGAGALRARLKTAQSNGKFFCQSTELARAAISLTKSGRIRKCVRDFRVGTYGGGQLFWLIISASFRKSRQKLRGEWPRGTQTRTPDEILNLQPGEWVQVKTLDQIVQTLDKNGKNRGLHFSEDMIVFCGRKFRVRNRLDRMIIEATGQMRDLKNTVILDNVRCGCPYTFGGCPRGVFQYWREIWLQRALPD